MEENVVEERGTQDLSRSHLSLSLDLDFDHSMADSWILGVGFVGFDLVVEPWRCDSVLGFVLTVVWFGFGSSDGSGDGG
ncbi:hypothetical protein QYF36_007648 [Acer negundo]|nr:hypothetical protein QYF36_007648 [Acer negundo]